MLGLDCATPELLFERFREELPALARLMDSGTYGPLHSVHPPVTVPAWTSMFTGRDPGELGLYGFRSRPDRSYARPVLNDASRLPAPALWDLFGAMGLESIVIGHPQTYPPQPVRGALVSGMLSPPAAERFTWPHELGSQIRGWVGDYVFDADAHRTDDRDALREQVFGMTRARFRVARELAASRPWDFLFLHEIGLDRLQHAFWPQTDDPADPAAAVLLEYHQLLDLELAETLAALPEETAVWVLSDHGARAYEGTFCVNEWLRDQGYLRLHPSAQDAGNGERLRIEPEHVDWARTRAWADGGYCGRIYLNVEGREPEGVVPMRTFSRLRDEIRCKLEDMAGPDDEPLASAVYLPEEVYARTTGVPPDLLVYPGDLRMRCAATLGRGPSVGSGDWFLETDDLGPDAANHDWEGVFVWTDPAREARGRVPGARLLDVAPTLLEGFGAPAPGWMRGGRIEWA